MIDTKTFKFSQLVRRCRNGKDLVQGRRAHAQIVDSGLLQDRFLANLLVEMFGKCGAVEDARSVFDQIKEPNLFSWTNMFSAYAQNGHLEQAREMFSRMPKKDQVAWNAMIQAYTCNGNLFEAKNLFDRMSSRNVVSWTTVLAAYAQNGYFDEVKDMFDRIPQKDMISYNAMMQAVYQSKGLETACEMFDSMPGRDIASWNTIFVANAQSGYVEKATQYFNRMPMHNFISCTIMFITYAQNGCLDTASEIFFKLPQRKLVEWNAMLQGYSQNGYAEDALTFFSFMGLEGVIPDISTFTSVFTACNHIGHVELGRRYFHCMIEDYDLRPTYQHLTCMIDILARAGWLQEAEELAALTTASDKSIRRSTTEPDLIAWKSLAAGCNLHGDTERGERLVKWIMEAHSGDAASYIMLSNFYAQDEAAGKGTGTQTEALSFEQS